MALKKFDKIKSYEREVFPHVKKIYDICREYDLPALMAFAVKSDGKGRTGCTTTGCFRENKTPLEFFVIWPLLMGEYDKFLEVTVGRGILGVKNDTEFNGTTIYKDEIEKVEKVIMQKCIQHKIPFLISFNLQKLNCESTILTNCQNLNCESTILTNCHFFDERTSVNFFIAQLILRGFYDEAWKMFGDTDIGRKMLRGREGE